MRCAKLVTSDYSTMSYSRPRNCTSGVDAALGARRWYLDMCNGVTGSSRGVSTVHICTILDWCPRSSSVPSLDATSNGVWSSLSRSSTSVSAGAPRSSSIRIMSGRSFFNLNAICNELVRVSSLSDESPLSSCGSTISGRLSCDCDPASNRVELAAFRVGVLRRF